MGWPASGEAVCLSTCNRTELYLVDTDPEAAEARASKALLGDEVELYRMTDEAAALHLFRVAAGLDSLVPGEGEILGQVRDAYEAGAHGPVLDRLFREALRVGKKVRTETAINESPASVSSAAAALAQQVFGDLTGCRVLLVGAGEVSELAARALAARGATIGAVTSRTQANARRAGRGVRRARGSVRPARTRARPRGRRRLLDELAGAGPVARTSGARPRRGARCS